MTLTTNRRQRDPYLRPPVRNPTEPDAAQAAAAATPAPRGGRLSSLDALRVLAAAGVLMFHFTARKGADWGMDPVDAFPHLSMLTRFGNLGVELFFAISGFVILMTAWGRSVPHFVASRVGRLYPAYWASVLLTGALMVAWQEFDPLQALTNLSMVQEPLGARQVSGVYWTLWVELRFYLLIGLFMIVGITRQRVLAVAVLWPVLGVTLAAAGWKPVEQVLFPTYAPFFAFGMALFLVYREGSSIAPWLVMGLNALLGMNMTVQKVLPGARRSTGDWYPGWLVALLTAVLLLCVVVAVLTPLAHRGGPRLALLGALTYPVYLLHEEWGRFVVDALADTLGTFGTLAVAITLTLLLAYGVHRLVERRYGRRLRVAVQNSLEREDETLSPVR